MHSLSKFGVDRTIGTEMAAIARSDPILLEHTVLVSHLHPPQLLVRDRQDLSRRIISTTSVCEVVVDLQHEIRVLQALLGIFETTAERVLPDDTRTAAHVRCRQPC